MGPYIDVVLADGGVARLRQITPADAAALAKFHEALSPETVYMRFFTSHPHLEPAEVAHLTDVDGHERDALVATCGDEIVAVGRWDRLPGSTAAEVAFVVADDHHGRGIGTLLLEHLAERARREGVARFEADVLRTNRPMLEVFETVGFSESESREDGVVRVGLSLTPGRAALEAAERREHRAEVASLARLLRPSTVALRGPAAEGTIGGEILRALRAGAFSGEILQLPGEGPPPGWRADLLVDAASATVPELIAGLDAAAALGAGGLLAVAPFDQALDTAGVGALRDAARSRGVRLVGPQSVGLLNSDPAARLRCTYAGAAERPGSVGLFAQSGAIGAQMLAEARGRRIGVSAFVSVGDKADVSGNDLLQWFEDDRRTAMVGLYLESLGNARKFHRLAKRVSRRKPIVALKAGREGDAEQDASQAAGVDAEQMLDAALWDAGVIRVPDLETFFDTISVLATQPLPGGPAVAVVAASGGAGVLARQALAAAGLDASTLGALPEVPLTAPPETWRDAVREALRSPAADAVIACPVATAFATPAELAAALHRAQQEARVAKPLAIVLADLRGVRSEVTASVAHTRTVEGAAAAIANAWRYATWRSSADDHSSDDPGDPERTPAGVDLDAAAELASRWLAERGPGWLDVQGCEELLATAGIQVLPGKVVHSAGEASAAAAQFGSPVAVKALGSGIVSRSAARGVVLDVVTPQGAAYAYELVRKRLGAAVEAVLVQPMADPGHEVLVGAATSPRFGTAVMVGQGEGLGGARSPQVVRLGPLAPPSARSMATAAGAGVAADAARHLGPVDADQVEELLLRVDRLVCGVREIAEVALDPAVATTAGPVVVDARVRLDWPRLDTAAPQLG